MLQLAQSRSTVIAPKFHDGLFRLFEPGKARGYTVAIQVFLDESGKISDSKYIVVCAVAAIPAAWEALSDKWAKKLQAADISCLSMKEAVRFRGQFADWKQRIPERDDLLRTLAQYAASHVSIATTFYVAAANFHSTSASQKKGLWNNPLYPEVEGCIKHVMERTDPREPLQLCFDNSEEYGGEILKIYNQMRRFDAEFKRRCGQISFGEDEFFIGLQFADMYAYCVREQLAADGAPVPLVDELMAIIAPDGYHEDEFGYQIGKGIGDGKVTLHQRTKKE